MASYFGKPQSSNQFVPIDRHVSVTSSGLGRKKQTTMGAGASGNKTFSNRFHSDTLPKRILSRNTIVIF